MAVTIWIDNGEEYEEVALPITRIVCPRCQGLGVHDAWEGGMTRDEMDDMDPDFFDDYRDGLYNVPCTRCHGRNVIEVVDESRLSPALRAAWDDDQRAADEVAQMERMERLMGC